MREIRMSAGRPALTQAELKEILHYSPDTGVFTWLVSCGSVAGAVAGYLRPNGYITIGINSKHYRAHRVAYVYMVGNLPSEPFDIDHVNGTRSDNRWGNLRVVSRTMNMQNAKRNIKNTSGVTGVCWDINNSKWKSAIVVGYKHINLGRYASWFDAVCARKSAESKYGFHMNHGRAA